MLNNTQDRDFKTLGYVLRRTNYGEADRILNVITPIGKIPVIAKGVRKAKSKLAGGVEMLSLVELHIHRDRSEFGIVTSAKMLKYYGNLLKDFTKMELAALILKKISLASESSDSPEFFEIVDQGLSGLNMGLNEMLIESWFWLNLAKASGEEVNLYRDVDGNKLLPEERYEYDIVEKALVKHQNGEIGAEEIKILRLLITNKLTVVARIKDLDEMLPKVLRLARIMSGAV